MFRIIWFIYFATVYAASLGPCKSVHVTEWKTEYIEIGQEKCSAVYVHHCETVNKKECKQVEEMICTSVQENQCRIELEKNCTHEERTEFRKYNETVCTTMYIKNCNSSIIMEGNRECTTVPYESCTEVPRVQEVLTIYPVCKNIPHEKCLVVPKQKCAKNIQTVCSEVPYSNCKQDVPKKKCVSVPKKVPRRVSYKALKEICQEDTTEQINIESFEEIVKII